MRSPTSSSPLGLGCSYQNGRFCLFDGGKFLGQRLALSILSHFESFLVVLEFGPPFLPVTLSARSPPTSPPLATLRLRASFLPPQAAGLQETLENMIKMQDLEEREGNTQQNGCKQQAGQDEKRRKDLELANPPLLPHT